MEASDRLAELATRGWTWTDSEQVYAQLRDRLGSEVRQQTLRPTTTRDARMGTHSAAVGFGQFPWHTDGAIALKPPQWMVLKCRRADVATSTELCLPDHELRQQLASLTLRIRQESGRHAYVPALMRTAQSEWRLRWDPRATAIGPRIALDAVTEAVATDELPWEPGRVLIVNNHRVLHRRPPVDPDAHRELVRVFLVK